MIPSTERTCYFQSWQTLFSPCASTELQINAMYPLNPRQCPESTQNEAKQSKTSAIEHRTNPTSHLVSVVSSHCSHLNVNSSSFRTANKASIGVVVHGNVPKQPISKSPQNLAINSCYSQSKTQRPNRGGCGYACGGAWAHEETAQESAPTTARAPIEAHTSALPARPTGPKRGRCGAC